MGRVRKAAAVALAVTALLVGAPAAASADTWPTQPTTVTLPIDDLDAVDAQGRILLVSVADGPARAEVRRASRDGVLDSAFGTGGVATVALDAGVAEPRLTVLDDGALLLDGPGVAGHLAWRLSPDGVVDASYAGDGRLEVALGVVDVAGDGSLTSARGNGAAKVVVERTTAAGGPDLGFGTGGTVSETCCAGASGDAAVVASALEPGGPVRYLVRTDGAAFVASVEPTGAVAAAQVDAAATDLADDGSGGILVAASGSSVRRLGPDLVADPGFAGTGLLALTGSLVDLVRWDDRTVVVTRTETALEGTIHLSAVTAAGLDLSFGAGGTASVASGRAPSTPVGMEGDRQGITGRTALVTSAGAAGLVVFHQWSWPPGLLLPSVATSGLAQFWPDGTLVAARTLGPMGGGSRLLVAQGDTAFHAATTFPVAMGSVVRKVFRTSLVPPPAFAAAPAPPSVAVRAPASVHLTWPPVPAPAAGAPITGARITVYENGTTAPVAVVDRPGATTAADVEVPTPGAAHRFTVELATWSGWGPASARSAAVVAPFPSALAFVEQLSQDLRGRPTGAPIERVAPLAALDAGASAAEVALDTLDGSGWRGTVDPVIRLYDAYLQRVPDPSGLAYWSARRDQLTVAAISARFATSPEFVRTYGSLSDRAFVELVYRNVLRREGDGDGIAYWTGRLQRRAATRGHLMASFSESDEHVRALAPSVDAIDVHAALLRRLPTTAELARWVAPARPGTTVDLIAEVLEGAEYQGRVG